MYDLPFDITSAYKVQSVLLSAKRHRELSWFFKSFKSKTQCFSQPEVKDMVYMSHMIPPGRGKPSFQYHIPDFCQARKMCQGQHPLVSCGRFFHEIWRGERMGEGAGGMTWQFFLELQQSDPRHGSKSKCRLETFFLSVQLDFEIN